MISRTFWPNINRNSIISWSTNIRIPLRPIPDRKKLSDRHHNICVVGDDAQSIYSFRGARIENILNFKNDYPEYKLYKLEQNYRSTTTIVDAANCVISKNKEQIPKKTFSKTKKVKRSRYCGPYPIREEGFQVTNEIFRLANYEQQEYSDFAILYRTNAQSRILEEALRKRNIPYKIYGGQSFLPTERNQGFAGLFPVDRESER